MRKISEFITSPLVFKILIVLVIILAVIASIFIYENPIHPLTSLLNSNYFVALVTGIAGAVAFLIYFKQKADTKRDAAKTILAEITNSEKTIQEVKNIKKFSGYMNLDPDPLKFYLGNFSWNQYKYLFIGDFDSYEWEKINQYFSQCGTFNEAIKNIANLLPQNIEYRMQFLQQELAKIASEQADEVAKLEKPDGKNDKTRQEKIKEISEKYEQKGKDFVFGYIEAEKTSLKYVYTPANAYEPLNRELDKIDTEISKSSIGKKLVKLAR
ncbi:MAG: hypothetical protein QY314_01345 [Candidatus Dojkabacteria bacterium]|nr:MAG: hypothetical protein QY314_01345 [Candidatus Dojkabacteria bacterium]